MRLSTIFELLLIFLLVAFAAYGRVIDPNEVAKDNQKSIQDARNTKQTNLGMSTLSLKQATDNVNRYCTCNENICNCCRDFHIPLVRLQGPGCASLQYIQGDNLALQLSFGDNILTSTVVNGKNPKPVCVPLPGGFSKFCGRVYSIQRDVKNHFKACLGLELQSATELEASLRVSCFRFGPDGLKLRPAEPLPLVTAESAEEDDDDDLFGLGSDDDDEEDEDYTPEANSVSNPAEDGEEEEEEDEDDVLGLGALFDIITGEDETSTKKPKIPTTPQHQPLEFTIPILSRPTTPTPLEPHEPPASFNDVPNDSGFDEVEQTDDSTEEPIKLEVDASAELEDQTEGSAEISDDSSSAEVEVTAESTNKITQTAKPNKNVPSNKLKKTTVPTKKPSITSASINAIDNGSKKPVVKPVKNTENDDDDDILGDDDDDDDDDDDLLDDDDKDDDDDDKDDDDDDEDDEKTEELNDQKHDDEDEDEKAEDLDDLDDDDDDEEDAVLTALIDGEKGNKNKLSHLSSSAEEDDYSLGFTELLARKRSMRNGRQNKVMRL